MTPSHCTFWQADQLGWCRELQVSLGWQKRKSARQYRRLKGTYTRTWRGWVGCCPTGQEIATPRSTSANQLNLWTSRGEEKKKKAISRNVSQERELVKDELQADHLAGWREDNKSWKKWSRRWITLLRWNRTVESEILRVRFWHCYWMRVFQNTCNPPVIKKWKRCYGHHSILNCMHGLPLTKK